MKQVIQNILDNYNTFSKGQKKIADYVVNRFDKAAFMTAAKLGEKVGVSESTVVRFASELGFSKYSKFQTALQEIVRTKLTSVQRIEVANDRIGDTEKEIVTNVLNRDIQMIKSTLDLIDRDEFASAVDAIVNAKKIYILGVRSSSSLANFLAFNFNLVFDNVVFANSASGSEIFESIFRIQPDDVCIGISFPRYSARIIKALNYVNKRGAKIVAITDNNASPVSQLAQYKLLACSDMVSFVDSLVAPLSVINALIAACTFKKKDSVMSNFEQFEAIWKDSQTYQENTNSEQ